MFNKVLIANRGAIAVRILRTLKQLDIQSVAVYAESDYHSPHVALAGEAFSLGEGGAAQTYLNQQKIFDIIEKTGADAVHPGYGFLSENAGFCEALESRGLAFIGPTVEQMLAFGLKHEARALAEANGVPLLSGSSLLDNIENAVLEAQRVGYPVMLKSTAGGGGIGMQVCADEHQLRHCWEGIKRLGENNFSNSGVFVEKYIEFARHIEVQIFGDGKGKALVLGDRDCSCQRRNQKVIEEAPAPNIPDQVRHQLHEVSKTLVEAVNYRNAGTVEFIYNQNSNEFYFLEMNTRLQVEHGVTEEVFGVDLVDWMLRLASGDLPPLSELEKTLKPEGHAVQARIYAENPTKDFQPSVGRLQKVYFPENMARIDHWVESGSAISAYFDPMLAKVICHKKTRESAIAALLNVLQQSQLEGLETNKYYVEDILQTDVFRKGEMYTRYLSKLQRQPDTCDVIAPGTMTTIQDYPGRIGYWDVGVPPSGPFDSYSFRLGNRLLGNPENAAGLEITLNGPSLKFNCRKKIVVCGANMDAQLDGQPIELNSIVTVEAGQLLKLGKVHEKGARVYCLFEGGLHCADYLGSKSTFTLGQFGGVSGQALRTGDVLRFEKITEPAVQLIQKIPEALLPELSNNWTLRVIYGPHGAPDFFTQKDIDTFFSAEWQVHYNSSRTGVRLIGPKPEWARTDGGEAGLHPSNIHDNAYAIGSIDFTGDMPVILGPDGPSLGGFVCPATVVSADLWKLGQLRAGDKIQFERVSTEQAIQLLQEQSLQLETLELGKKEPTKEPSKTAAKAVDASNLSPILKQNHNGEVPITYRVAGDQNILVEFGALELDIKLRFRAHALMLWLEEQKKKNAHWASALLDLTPGIRSLQVHYDPLQVSQAYVLALLESAEGEINDINNLQVPSRIVHLPLSWDDEQCRLAVQKYMQSVRANAPWCPDNIEFIRRINGLESVEDVKKIVFDASYVVMGLGDVYLGAPVATPMDPRHRLVTTKYNPARTWTAENSVGIGGSYMCVYGMEGPGGYQFVGRTLQMWNRYRSTENFSKPWLLRFFDQIRFYEVSHEELEGIRRDFPLGRYKVEIEETAFSLADYENIINNNSEGISKFVKQRQVAFNAELEYWRESGLIQYDSEPALEDVAEEETLLEGCELVESPVSGNLWQMVVSEGDYVKEGDVLCILESMKMEIEIHAPQAGTVQSILKKVGQGVSSGQGILILKDS